MYYELLNSIYKYYNHYHARPPRPRTSSCRSTAGCRSCPQSRSGWTWILGEKRLVIIGIIFWKISCFSIAYIWLSMLSSVIVSVYNQIMPLQSLIKIRPLLPSAKPCIPKYDHPQYIVCFFFNFYIFAHFSTWHLRWRGNSSNKGFCCCLKYETHLRGNNSFPLWRYS